MNNNKSDEVEIRRNNMSESLTVRKTIYVPHGWDESLWRRALAFWQERDFRFEERRGERQVGKRGNFWGNLTSCNMSRLRTTITVTRLDLTRVEFVMEVNTAAQIITEWNEEHWRREMETLESWLMEGDKKEDEWQRFHERCRKKDRDMYLSWFWKGVPRRR
jgi:hypothetical protein